MGLEQVPSKMKPTNTPSRPDPVVEAYKKDIDRTLIRENLKLSHEQRVLKLMELQRVANELREAGRRFRRNEK